MKRRLVYLVFAVPVLLVASLAAAALWALTSQSALDWTVARLHERFGDRVRIVGATRTGILSWDADRIRYIDAEREIEAAEVSLVVNSRSLLHGRVVVEALGIGDLRLASRANDARPPERPETLAAPIAFDVRALRVKRLVIDRPPAPLVFGDIDLGISYDGEAYTVAARRFGTPWAGVIGQATLGHAPPFGLEGALSVAPKDARIARVEVALSGDLSVLGVGAASDVQGQRVIADAAVTAFSPEQLAVIRARTDALNPRIVDASWPHALLDARLMALLGRDGNLTGGLRVVNRAVGMPAAGRVPVAALKANFAGAGTRWTLDELTVDAGRAGYLSGKAALAPSGIAAELRVERLDVSALYAKLAPSKLSGPLRVQSDGERVAIDTRLRQSGADFEVSAIYAAGRIAVSKASWTGAAGRIEAGGTANVASPHAFDMTGRLVGVDPSRLGDFPPARLSGSFVARGEAAPLSATVEARIADSRFRNQPLFGAARLQVLPERVRDAALDLRLGTATVQASGSFGAASDRLAWSLALPDASLLAADARGALKASGTLSGAWRAPSGTFELDAVALRLGNRFYVAKANGSGAVNDGIAGRVDITVDAKGLRWADARVDSARFTLVGRRDQHTATLEAFGADHRLDMRLAGGLDATPVWRGMLQSLDVRGPIPVRLYQPFELAIGRDILRVGSARFALGQGRVDLAGLDWSRARGLTTRGSLAAVTLGSLHPVLAIPEPLRALVVGGQWDMAMNDSLSGRVHVEREAGDIVLPGAPEIPAKLRTLTVAAEAQGSSLTLRAHMESDTFGRAIATGSMRAERRRDGWGIAGDAPLRAEIEASMPSLAWTRPLLGDAAALEGSGELSLRVRGTVADPVYAGGVRGQGLVARLPEFGLVLRDGVLDAVFDGSRLAIRTLSFHSGEGRITGSGSATLRPDDLAARLELVADKLTVLARPDRLAVVSGRVGIAWDRRELRAQGKLTADRGVVELPREDTPRPSSDVVVLGTKPATGREVPVQADLALDLGSNVVVRGRGLATRLGGTLRAQLAPRVGLTLTGAVRAVEGTYTAFGQKLDIQRGVLTFAGPVDNPALDILAVRKLTAVEVGVAVGGTALLPQVRLVSTPAMSDADKLAWLTLGHGLDQAGRNEAAVLQAAALALLSRGNTDSKGTLASRFGLDELSLGTASGTGERIVSVGKRFASNFYLGFERGITGAVSVIKITYDLSRRWSVQARAGSENALDLFYTLGFR